MGQLLYFQKRTYAIRSLLYRSLLFGTSIAFLLCVLPPEHFDEQNLAPSDLQPHYDNGGFENVYTFYI